MAMKWQKGQHVAQGHSALFTADNGVKPTTHHSSNKEQLVPLPSPSMLPINYTVKGTHLQATVGIQFAGSDLDDTACFGIWWFGP